MLCAWAVDHPVSGVGVDISRSSWPPLDGVVELNSNRITLVHAGRGKSTSARSTQFDIVSCIGATWIGGGLIGTLNMMRPPRRQAVWWLWASRIGSIRFRRGLSVNDVEGGDFESLVARLTASNQWASTSWNGAGRARRLGSVCGSAVDDGERLAGRQSAAPRRASISDWIKAGRRSHLTADRRYLGWGVFVLRVSNIAP